ncbi:MAG: amidohydrolase family protein [Actinomycetota bacterium]
MHTPIETVIVNARVRTMDPGNPHATAVAVGHGAILAIGSDAEIRELAGSAELIDLDGAALVPGITDSHVHPLMGALDAVGADLLDAGTWDEVLAGIRREAEGKGPDEWVVGWGLLYDAFEGREIHHALIEEAVGGRPTYLKFMDFHTVLASKRALDLAGIHGPVAFSENAEVVCDAAGVPTGELREWGAIAIVDAAEIADPALLLGVNTRVELAEAAALLRARLLEGHMLAGAGIVDPDSTYVDADVELAPDCVVHPGTVLRGATRLATGAEAGPHSVLDGAVLEAGAQAGPFAHLRPGTHLRAGARVGAFAETKNADVGARSKIPHLSYVGDAEIGEDTNIGAGNITANYDGVDKHRTVIGSRVRTGSDCVFVAPVSVGDDATTGAGSIITDDVPPGALGIARARQVVKENYAQRRRDD